MLNLLQLVEEVTHFESLAVTKVTASLEMRLAEVRHSAALLWLKRGFVRASKENR